APAGALGVGALSAGGAGGLVALGGDAESVGAHAPLAVPAGELATGPGVVAAITPAIPSATSAVAPIAHGAGLAGCGMPPEPPEPPPGGPPWASTSWSMPAASAGASGGARMASSRGRRRR